MEDFAKTRLGLAWLGSAWLGSAWLGLAWLGRGSEFGFEKLLQIFGLLLPGFQSVRTTHNRQVEDGRPLPFESFWADHIIDSYRLSIEESVRFLVGWSKPLLDSELQQPHDVMNLSSYD